MKNILIALAFIILYFFDLGNPDALRQGTEGFYLLITKEMYHAGNFITPLIYGEPHWSKPPLHFWLPMPFIKMMGDNFLLASRFSIALFSLLFTGLISLWYQNNFKRNWHEAFVFLVCPLYFFKYSRIFMMEMPLALISTLSCLYFYDYILRESFKKLLLCSIMVGLSTLVKGPVSLVFISAGCFTYTLIKRKSLKSFLQVFTVSALFSSIWFLASYFKHGDEFFHYFFIRENIGKFQSKSYPITSVIQGLILYTLPLFILIVPTLKDVINKTRSNSKILFLVLNFIFFYFIWFLPKQKSHHYAVPAIPLFLLIISESFFSLRADKKERWLRYLRNFMTIFIIFSLAIILLATYIDYKLMMSFDRIYLFGIIFTLALWFKSNLFKSEAIKVLRLSLPIILIWNFVIPIFYLPVVPAKVVELLKSEELKNYAFYVDYRKPFFVGQAVNRNVKRIDLDHLKSIKSFSDRTLIMAPSSKVGLIKSDPYKLIAKWSIWRRGIGVKQIIKAIKSHDLKQIQDEYELRQLSGKLP